MVIHTLQTKEEIQALLKRGLCEVVFTKKDGSERQMNCTLHPNYLPPPVEGGRTRADNPEVVPVWDLDEGAWRSFRIDSIKDDSLKLIEEI